MRQLTLTANSCGRSQLRLLRQLVDWQLVHSVNVRQTVAECYNVVHQKTMDFNKETNRLIVEPIAQDRTKRRFWSLDGACRPREPCARPFQQPS